MITLQQNAIFFRLTIPFIIGIGIQYALDVPLNIYTTILQVGLFGILLFLFKKTNLVNEKPYFGLSLNVFLLLLGFNVSASYHDIYKETHFTKVDATANQFIATIHSSPKVGKFINFNAKINALFKNGQAESATGNIFLQIEADSNSQNLQYGDVIQFEAQLKPFEQPKNPSQFDFGAYKKTENVFFTAFVKPNGYKIIERHQGNPIIAWSLKEQAKYVALLKEYLPENKDIFGIAASVIIGQKTAIPKEIKDVYIASGALHVLSVSGLHASILGGIILWIFKFLPLKNATLRRSKYAFALIAMWYFAFVTGASPPVLRAAFMFSCIMLSKMFHKSNNSYNALFASAFILLLFQPFILFDVGFQLSYLAMLGIMYFYPLIDNVFHPKNFILKGIWDSVAVSIAAQLMTFPLGLYYFQQFPTYFWLSSIIVTFLSSLILLFGLLLFLFHQLLGSFIAKILYGLVLSMNYFLEGICNLPMSVFSNLYLSLAILILFYVLIMFWILALESRRFQWILNGMGIALLICLIYAFDTIRNQEKQQMVIYYSNKNCLMDFIKGQERITVKNEIEQTRENFYAQNYRNELGIERFTNVSLKDSLFQNDFFQKRMDEIQFLNKRLLIVDKNIRVNTQSKVDVLLLMNSFSLDLADLIQKTQPQSIVIHPSVAYKYRKIWQEIAKQFNVSCHELMEKGAFILKN